MEFQTPMVARNIFLVVLIALITLGAAKLSHARTSLGIIQNDRGAGKELIIDIHPGETLQVTAWFNAANPHTVCLYESNNRDIDQIRRSGEHLMLQSSNNATRTIKVTDWYYVGSHLNKSVKMRIIETRDDYLKVGSEDGYDDDYNDAVIEVKLTRSSSPSGASLTQDYNRGYADGYQKGLAAGTAQCGGTSTTGTGPTGTSSQLPQGGAGTCNWLSAVQFAQVLNVRRGTRCGTRDSIELDVQNTASSNIKVVVYLEKSNGSWTQEPDGTFDVGMRPNAKRNWYTCSSTGRYKIVAMPIAEFLSGKCRYPDYRGN